MSEAANSSPKGSDWTRLLTDPDLVSHLGKLLQTYREVAPERREAALLEAMHNIKEAAAQARQAKKKQPAPAARAAAQAPEELPAPAVPGKAAALVAPTEDAGQLEPVPAPEPVMETPPFEPDLFTAQTGGDRRRYRRIKCYFAVEIHVEDVKEPIWGNLVNVSRGGCLVETVNAVAPGKALEIGLWVASGTIWVKGVNLSGVVTRSAPSFGIRVKFSETELAEKRHLREFLKFVEGTTRKAQSEDAYVARLKG